MAATAKSAQSQRHIYVPDDLWVPFLALEAQLDSSGAQRIRRLIATHLDEYGVFYAKGRVYYECEECNQAHRLDGVGAPALCSVAKAHADRKAAQR